MPDLAERVLHYTELFLSLFASQPWRVCRFDLLSFSALGWLPAWEKGHHHHTHPSSHLIG